jgi:hypothetical protein
MVSFHSIECAGPKGPTGLRKPFNKFRDHHVMKVIMIGLLGSSELLKNCDATMRREIN